MQISTKLAQNIVEEMMKVIPYNVNVMNENGVIVGSGDPKRIGDIHDGAVKAIEKKQKVEILEKGKLSEKGVNEPIFIDNELIGVVGITGPPEEICRFSKLVGATAILLIEQARKMKDIQQKEKKLEEFLYKLVFGKSAYSDEFCNIASAYNIDLSLNYYCVLIYCVNAEKFEKKIREIVPVDMYFLRLDSERIVLFVKEDVKRERLLNSLLRRDEVLKVGVGDFTIPFNMSYEKAHLAIEVGSRITENNKLYLYGEWEFLIGLGHINKENRTEIIRRLHKVGGKLDLLKTLQVFIEENGEMNETSNRLNIHRNTLNYRLDKICELTGKHPKNLLDLFELLTGLIWCDF